MTGPHEIPGRLDEEIDWYSRSSGRHRRTYYLLKAGTIVAAGTIPVLATLNAAPVFTAALGSLVLAIQGFEQLLQNQQHWIGYRLAAEDLKRERSLFVGRAGPYRTAKDARALLVERTEARIAAETGGWRQVQQEAGAAGDGQ
jgi:hypothetical protein